MALGYTLTTEEVKLMDEATLRFWEALEEKENAERNYIFAEKSMRNNKAAYLRKKLELK